MEIEITRAVALISINATLVAQLVSFLILVMLISRLMYHPLRDTIKERDRQVEMMGKEIEAASTDLDDISLKTEAETQRIKNEAYDIQHRLEKEATQQADELMAQVNTEIERLSKETDLEVQLQIDDVRQHLSRECEKLSKVIMEKALSRKLTSEAGI